ATLPARARRVDQPQADGAHSGGARAADLRDVGAVEGGARDRALTALRNGNGPAEAGPFSARVLLLLTLAAARGPADKRQAGHEQRIRLRLRNGGDRGGAVEHRVRKPLAEVRNRVAPFREEADAERVEVDRGRVRGEEVQA